MTDKQAGEAAAAGLDGKTLESRVMSVICALPLSPLSQKVSHRGRWPQPRRP